MSTSFLYHGFGIRGYKYLRVKYLEGNITFTVSSQCIRFRCPECRSRNVIRKGQTERKFKTLPIGKKHVFVKLSIQRIQCKCCNKLWREQVAFADPRRSYTKALEHYALDLLRHMTIKDVASHLGFSWDVIKEIQKKHLIKKYSKPSLKGLQKIAIDEISIGKGNKYLTVVLDLNSGRVVFVGDGKGGEALSSFWKRIKRSKVKIKAVAIDMSPAYIKAVKENLENASIVFDHFHVIKLFNEKFSDFRRKLHHEVTEVMGKSVIKGTRWLLLKNPENLSEERNERQRLEEALELNKPLATVYYMKEDLRSLWSKSNKALAEKFIKDWIKRAQQSGIRMLIKFAKTLMFHLSGILSYFDFPISTGPLEGTNNKIKTMKRQAYGFRDMDFFKLKIMAIHKTKYALIGQ